LKKLTGLLSLVLAFVLILAALSGCSGSRNTSGEDTSNSGKEPVNNETGESKNEEENKEEEITMDLQGRTIRRGAWWTTKPEAGSSEGADREIERVAELEEKYNFKMEYVEVPYEQYMETFTASTLANDPFADFAVIGVGEFYPSLVTSGFLYPVSDLGVFDFDEPKWQKVSVEFGTYKGKVYGFEVGDIYVRGGLFWNKTMFEREGLPNLYELVDKKEWTWDKMLEIAQKATKDTDGDGIVDQWGIGGLDFDQAILLSNNTATVSIDDQGMPVFSLASPPAIEALQFYQDLIQVHKVMEIPPDGAPWDYATQQFQNGNYAMYYGYWWQAGGFRENMQDDYGFTFFPMGPNADGYYSDLTGHLLTVIPSTVKNPKEVAFIYDLYTEPYPDTDPDSWKEGYEADADDAETIETIGRIIKENLSVINVLGCFNDMYSLRDRYLAEIRSGSKTAKVAIEGVIQEAQVILDDAMKVTK